MQIFLSLSDLALIVKLPYLELILSLVIRQEIMAGMRIIFTHTCFSMVSNKTGNNNKNDW